MKTCEDCSHYSINMCLWYNHATTKASAACEHYSLKPSKRVCGNCARLHLRNKSDVLGDCKQMMVSVTPSSPGCYWFTERGGHGQAEAD